jgi:hypothetical protein
MVQELLNIEQILLKFKKKKKKNQNYMFLKILGFLFVFLESRQQVGFNGGDSRFFRRKLWDNFAQST